MIALSLMLMAQAQEAPDLQMDDDLAEFLSEQAAQWPDRKAPPAVVAAKPWELPVWEEHQLTPAVTVRHVHVEGVRKVELQLTRHKGSLDLAEWPSPALWAVGWLGDTATETIGASDLEVRQDLLDASVWTAGVGLHRAEVGFDVPLEDFDGALELFSSVLREPAYPKADVKRWARDEVLSLTVFGPSNPTRAASRALDAAWFPADSPYGWRESPDDYKKFDIGELKALNERLNAESAMTVIVVGDIGWDELEPKLLPVFEGLGAVGAEEPMPAFVAPAQSRFIAVHLPGAEQAVVRMRMAAPPRGDADEDLLDVVNWAYGGAFLARLNRSLREEKGWTYGSWSTYRARDSYGSFTVSFDTAAETTGDAITETERVLAELVADGCTAEEIDASVRESVGYWNDTLVDADTAASFYDDLFIAEQTVAEAREDLVAAASFTPEQTQETASRWLSADKPRVWVVVGDRDLLDDELGDLGWKWEWIDAQSAVLGEF